MKQRFYLILCLLFAYTSIYPKVLIWDIGGVLLKASRLSIGRSIGLSRFFSYMLFDWKSPHIEPLIFRVLDMIDCPPVPDAVHACTEKGVPLPAVMCHWQAGTLSGDQIIKMAEQLIDKLDEDDYFVSYRELNLVERTIQHMFNPHSLANAITPIESGIRLLKECAHEVDSEGAQRNQLIALSNWDPWSFDLVHDRFIDLFDHFNQIVISGTTGLIKPRKAAYSTLIETYKLKPQDCLFIDDQEVNLRAAEQVGFEPFLVTRNNYRQLKRKLIDCGALSDHHS